MPVLKFGALRTDPAEVLGAAPRHIPPTGHSSSLACAAAAVARKRVHHGCTCLKIQPGRSSSLLQSQITSKSIAYTPHPTPARLLLSKTPTFFLGINLLAMNTLQPLPCLAGPHGEDEFGAWKRSSGTSGMASTAQHSTCVLGKHSYEGSPHDVLSGFRDVTHLQSIPKLAQPLPGVPLFRCLSFSRAFTGTTLALWPYKMRCVGRLRQGIIVSDRCSFLFSHILIK